MYSRPPVYGWTRMLGRTLVYGGRRKLVYPRYNLYRWAYVYNRSKMHGRAALQRRRPLLNWSHLRNAGSSHASSETCEIAGSHHDWPGLLGDRAVSSRKTGEASLTTK